MSKKFIFTITTGRSGTKYLYNMFRRCCPDVAAFHERGNISTVMRKTNGEGKIDVAEKYAKRTKIPQVKRDIGRNEVYVETSHIVCKGLLEYLVEKLENIEVIYLYRNIFDVASSLYKHNTIPRKMKGRKYHAARYYLFWTDKTVLFDLREIDVELNDLDLCFWYCFEIMARAQEFENNYPRKIHRATLASLNTFGGVFRLFEEIGIENIDEEKIMSLVGKKVHVGHKSTGRAPSLDELNQSFIKLSKLYCEYV